MFGAPTFYLVTDHKPLIGIFQKGLQDISNRRLQRLRERVVDYSAKVKWVEGRSHLIADALSRSLLPIEKGDEINYVQVVQSLDPQLDALRNAASADEAYTKLTETFKSRSAAEVKRLPASHPCLLYTSDAADE